MPSNDSNKIKDEDNDVVDSILKGVPFKLRADGEKLAILEKGRPLVNFNVTKQDTIKNSNKTLHSSWYSIYKWLCGSKAYNKFFCWPCLLMRPETSSWCSTGNDDTTRLSSLARKHARSKSHLKAVCEYDEILINFNLIPQLINESKFLCKEECTSDKTETDNIDNDDDNEDDGGSGGGTSSSDDSVNPLLIEQNRKDIKEVRGNSNLKVTAAEHSHVSTLRGPSKTSRITFKTWQELYKDTFPVSKAGLFQDFQHYKWRKEIAKEELRNARLTGEKIKFEIEVIKVKLEYYKALKQLAAKGEHPQPASGSSL